MGIKPLNVLEFLLHQFKFINFEDIDGKFEKEVVIIIPFHLYKSLNSNKKIVIDFIMV